MKDPESEKIAAPSTSQAAHPITDALVLMQQIGQQLKVSLAEQLDNQTRTIKIMETTVAG